MLEQNFIPCGAAVFRRSCLFRVGLLDQSIPRIDDWDLWIRIAACYQVMVLERPVMVWRRSSPTSGQGTSGVDEIAAMSTRQIKRTWLKLPPATGVPASIRRDAGVVSQKNHPARWLSKRYLRSSIGIMRPRGKTCLRRSGCTRGPLCGLVASGSALRHLEAGEGN